MSVADDSGRVGESFEVGWQLIEPERSVEIPGIFLSYVGPLILKKGEKTTIVHFISKADRSKSCRRWVWDDACNTKSSMNCFLKLPRLKH